MGELIQESLSTGLLYAPVSEVQRALLLVASAEDRAALFADLCRLNALYMIARAGSGHIGSSFSSLDIVSWLLLEEMSEGDLYFSSKGHDAPGLYAALIGLGRLPHTALHRLRRLGGLPGHPDVHTPGIVANTGSLGMGISKAKGMVLAHRLQGEARRVFVLTGDGELQEGQIWESLSGAAAHAMRELTVVVDHNKVQSDRLVSVTSDLGDIATKFASFGWHVARVDGHDHAALRATFAGLRDVARPKVVIADTIKGRGVSFMEHTALPDARAPYRYHSGAPDADTYARAATELRARIDCRLDRMSAPGAVSCERVELPPAKPAAPVQRLIAAYGRTLLEYAFRDQRIVALDADLMVDMGLLPFAQALPERFVECGIAEMDMVSQAGGLALRGLLPVCHSFACFLSTRANEQIYTNATERTKVIYVAGLAGLLPGGPGHSHQSVRDISALGAIPGLELIQPSDELEVELALAYAFERAPGSCYIRLCSVPCAMPFELPAHGRIEPGRGALIRPGDDATILAYGPIMLAQSWLAAEWLARSHGVNAQVIALPWLNRLDADWLLGALGDRRWLFTVDDHYVRQGLGDLVFGTLLEHGVAIRGHRFGVEDIPACGTNEEVLAYHQLDAESLGSAIARAMQRCH